MTFSPDILLKPAPWKEELSRPVLLELCNGRDATVGDVSTGAEREEGWKELVYLESIYDSRDKREPEGSLFRAHRWDKRLSLKAPYSFKSHSETKEKWLMKSICPSFSLN